MIRSLFAHDVAQQIGGTERSGRRNAEFGNTVPILVVSQRHAHRDERQGVCNGLTGCFDF